MYPRPFQSVVQSVALHVGCILPFLSAVRFNQTKSKYPQHLMECNHEYGKIANTMEAIK
jgi:hypothetical protein